MTYNTFRKPLTLSKGTHTSTFTYGPDRSHYKRVDADGTVLQTSTGGGGAPGEVAPPPPVTNVPPVSPPPTTVTTDVATGGGSPLPTVFGTFDAIASIAWPGYQLGVCLRGDECGWAGWTWGIIGVFPAGQAAVGSAGRLARLVTNKGWKLGDDVFNLTAKGNQLSWTTVRSRFWKNESSMPGAADKYGAENLERMVKGRAPQRYNADKGGIESMELSHEPIPFRDGGKDFIPRWPQDHAAVDPFRRPGY